MIKIHTKTVFVFLLSFLLASSLAYAVSITPGLVRMDFQSRGQLTIQFSVDRAESINVYLVDGDLGGYMTLIDPKPYGGPRTVTVELNLPDKIDKPGKNIGYVAAKEMGSETSAVSALAEIRAPIVVNVPYPGYYADMVFSASNVNEGEPEPFKLTVTNLGTETLERVYAVIDVYTDSQKIKSITTDTITILSTQQGGLDTQMSTAGIKSGLYKAVATLYYDGGNSLSKEATFNIGTLYMQINNYTDEMTQGGIQRFDFEVESKWNNKIEDVYGTVLFEGTEIQTSSQTFQPWEKKVLSAYIDTSNQPYGDHGIKMTVYYEDKTTIEQGTVKLVPLMEEKEPESEKPSGEIVLRLNTTTILIAVIVLLVLADIVWLLLKNRQNNEGIRKRK